MKKIKLAIIEDNKDICKNLTSYINENFYESIEIVGTAHDGSEGLKLISEQKPNMALIDIVLPVLDGISILEKLNQMHLIDSVCCAMLTAVSHDDIIKKALELGAKYYFLKPFDNEILVNRLLEINDINLKKLKLKSQKHKTSEITNFNKRSLDDTPEMYATSVLQKIGIPVNLTGYYYLRRAIVHCIEDKSLLSALTKVLYPTIGKEFKTTGQRVERSIRHSIEKAWEADASDKYYSLLSLNVPEKNSKPSNGVLIMDLVDYYRTNNMK